MTSLYASDRGTVFSDSSLENQEPETRLVSMKLLENKWFWVVAFGTLFVVSLDLWAWDWTEPSVLGLPYIIVYTVLIEVILFVLLVLFSKYYWKIAEGDEP